MKKTTIFLFVFVFSVTAIGKDIKLPKVSSKAGMDIIQAIEQRSAARRFSAKNVSLKDVGAILWAGYGIISKSGSKTVHGYDAVSGASSQNRYSVAFGWETPYLRVYLLMKSGAYEYLAKSHKLRFITKENLISQSGVASSSAAGVIIVCADYAKLSGGKTDTTRNVVYYTAGSVAQSMSTIATAYKIQMLTQVYFRERVIKTKLKLSSKVEPLAMISFGYRP